MTLTLRIGSRPSALAIAQAELVSARLRGLAPRLEIEIVPIRTSGDRLKSASLAKLGGKGLFIKELEQALGDGRVDICVHSMKDLPARLAEGFRIAAVPEREDPCDALVTRLPGGLKALPRGARVGTSSSRRHFQARRLRPDLAINPLRGNVDTRLARVAGGELDAIIVAVAGLKRLGRLDELSVEPLDERDFVPAGGQGALAIETVAARPLGGSKEAEHLLGRINDRRAMVETYAERAFLATIGASCASPIGVRAAFGQGRIVMSARLFSLDGSREMGEGLEAPLDLKNPAAPPAAQALGILLARTMLSGGAAKLIGAESEAGPNSAS
jgi:hydroxymethylbilane synthase